MCFSNPALVEAMFEAPRCLKNRVFETSILASVETLLLKDYHRGRKHDLIHARKT